MLSFAHRGRHRGLTLIELLVALAIIGVVLMLAMPNYRAWIQNTRIRNTAESMLNGLQTARAEAVRRNAPVQFVLGTGTSWTVSCVSVRPGCPDTNAIQSHATGEGSSTAISVTANDGTTISFDSLGRMSTPAAVTMTQLNVDVDTSVLPADQSRELRITVDRGGNTRMCDPNLSSPDPRAC